MSKKNDNTSFSNRFKNTIPRDKNYDLFKLYIDNFIRQIFHDKISPIILEGRLAHVKDIKMRSSLDCVGKTVLENGVLKLPTVFFDQKLTTTEDVADLLNRHPVLQDLLTIYGITSTFKNAIDDEEDLQLKNMIASFYAAENRNNSLHQENTIGATFNTHANVNIISENVIREIYLLFGEDILLEALTNGKKGFASTIDKIIGKKGIGDKFTSTLLKLDEISMNASILESIQKRNNILQERQIGPFCEKLLSVEDSKLRRTIIDSLYAHDFDFTKVEGPIDFSSIPPLTISEKKALKSYIELFSLYSKDDSEEYSIISKIMSQMIFYEERLQAASTITLKKWADIQGIISNEIIPLIVPYRYGVDYESILTLGTVTQNDGEIIKFTL